MEQLLTIRECSKIIRKNHLWLYDIIKKDHTFPVIALGRNYRIKYKDLMEWLDKKKLKR